MAGRALGVEEETNDILSLHHLCFSAVERNENQTKERQKIQLRPYTDIVRNFDVVEQRAAAWCLISRDPTFDADTSHDQTPTLAASNDT